MIRSAAVVACVETVGFSGMFSKGCGKMFENVENQKIVRILWQKQRINGRFRRKSVENRKKKAQNPLPGDKSTRVFNNLWKTVLETFHRSNRKNMVIQSRLKTPVESRFQAAENPKQRQKKKNALPCLLDFQQKSTRIHKIKPSEMKKVWRVQRTFP